MKLLRNTFCLPLLLAGCVLSCWGGPVEGGPNGAKPPAAGTLSGDAFADVTKRIRQGDFGEIHSLLVYKGGQPLYEQYFDGYDAERIHEAQSITKSVASLLIGIAIDQGKIRGVDQKLLGFFPGREIANRDERKAAITLEDVLTMRSGLDWAEHATPYGDPANPLGSMHRSRDWIQFVLDRPMKDKPGEVFQYNSGGVLLLSAVLRQATGTDPEAFAKKHLFDPLGIEADWRFSTPDGLPHTGGGLYTTPRALVRLGQLVLDGGRWQGRQIVSEKWVRKSMSRLQVDVRPRSPIKLDYGYLWWTLSLADPGQARRLGGRTIQFAWGADGQFIFVVPEEQMVVVTTAGNYEEDFLSLDLLLEGVFPAVVSPQRKPAPRQSHHLDLWTPRPRSPDRAI